MKHHRYYPNHIFSINEDTTRRNMREYDRQDKLLWDTFESRYTEAERNAMNLRERWKIMRTIKEELALWIL